MKKVLFTLLVLLLTTGIFSQSRIITNIKGFENNKGVARACLFNSSTSFNGEGGTPFKCAQVIIRNKTAQVIFDDVPPGTYAIFVFHDVNENNKMDKNFLGIPSEGYGASKNKLPFASAPTFNSNKFAVQANTTTNLSISLRNL